MNSSADSDNTGDECGVEDEKEYKMIQMYANNELNIYQEKKDVCGPKRGCVSERK